MPCATILLWLTLYLSKQHTDLQRKGSITFRFAPLITNDEKADLLGLLRSFKKYGLVWEEKLEEVEERLREEIPVLTEVKERAIISDCADAPNHILIEGDNLEALTTLSYTHEGAIDVIYIDPPYNTGNKDFIYNDKFVDAEDEYRHSKWLSFMSKRLRIAKRLLSDKGVIFISIDEHEEANLKLVCDDIFLERNFIGNITWESTTQPINAGSARFQLQQKTEFVLCYAKDKANKPPFILKKDKSSSPNYPHKGTLGACRLEIIEKSDAGQYKRETMKYSILGRYPREGKRWQIGEETAKWLIENNRIEIVDGIVKKAIYPEDEADKVKYIPFWSHFTAESVGSALKAKEELNEVMGRAVGFDTVKPTTFISALLEHFHKGIVILDFFAGSGTTLHATMRLNAEDGGNRKCILVTNNENGICENVTYLRNKKVIEGYTTPKGEEVAGLTNNTLRYYRTEFLPRERSPRNMRALVSLATDLLCIKEDLYTEQKMFGKYPTHPKLMRYFANDKKHMLILYKEEAVFDIVEEIKNMEFNGKLKIYIFTPGRYPFSDDFFEVQDKVELVALPAAIYDAYTRVLPKQKEKYLTPEKEGEATPQTLFNDNEEGEE